MGFLNSNKIYFITMRPPLFLLHIILHTFNMKLFLRICTGGVIGGGTHTHIHTIKFAAYIDY